MSKGRLPLVAAALALWAMREAPRKESAPLDSHGPGTPAATPASAGQRALLAGSRN